MSADHEKRRVRPVYRKLAIGASAICLIVASVSALGFINAPYKLYFTIFSLVLLVVFTGIAVMGYLTPRSKR